MTTIPKTAETARAHHTLAEIRGTIAVVRVQPMDGPALTRDFNLHEWIEFARLNPPTPQTAIDGVNGKLFVDWGKNTELRWVARDDLDRIVATFPEDALALDVVAELKTMGIPAGTRMTIRKETVEIDEGTGALLG